MNNFHQKSIRYFLLLLIVIIQSSTSSAQDSLVADKAYENEIVTSPKDEIDSYSENTQHSLNEIEYDKLDSSSASKMIHLRKLDEAFFQKLQNDKAFDYVKTGIPKPKMDSPKRSILPDFDFQLLLRVIAIILFLIILFWYLKNNKLLLFRKKPASMKDDEYMAEPEDIFSTNFDAAIQKALSKQEYRQAIRLQYFQVLKKLKEAGLIHYMPDKTNFDYLMQLKSSACYDEFLNATRFYEYSWYGLFEIDNSKYQRINHSFVELNKKLSQ